MVHVLLACRKADESDHQHYCSTELAMVSSQGAAAGELVLGVFLEMVLDEIWHSFAM